MLQKRTDAIVLLSHGKPVTIVTDADLFRGMLTDERRPWQRVHVREYMSRLPAPVGPETTLAQAIEQMLLRHADHLPVIGHFRLPE